MGGAAAQGGGGVIPESVESEKPLDKQFGYPKNFTAKYELGHEVGRGHFGHTCFARVRRGDLKGQPIAVKIISKAKVTTHLFFHYDFPMLKVPPYSLENHLPTQVVSSMKVFIFSHNLFQS